MKTVCFVALNTSLFAFLFLSPAAPAAQSQTPQLVSIDQTGARSGNDGSGASSLSADGRFVAFGSGASDLVAGDTNGFGDVFVRDTWTGATTLVSVNREGTASANRYSANGLLSRDGRFIAFNSSASDIAENDTNGIRWDVFVRDLQTGATTLASGNRLGTGTADRSSILRAFSADGQVVVFESDASDLVAGDTNATYDLFAFDRRTGQTELITANLAGTGGGNILTVSNVAVSADGRYVTFSSRATNLTTQAGLSGGNVFRRDRLARTTMLVSVDTTGGPAPQASASLPDMSGDGRLVVFNTNARLDPLDTNRNDDIYVRDLEQNTTVLVSVNSQGTGGGSAASFRPSISANGRVVVWLSQATDLAPGSSGTGTKVFARDLSTGVTRRLAPGDENPTVSADGRFVAFESPGAQIYLADLQADTTRLVSVGQTGSGVGNNASALPLVSADGRTVAFTSAASNLVAGDANNTSDAFVFRLARPGRPNALLPGDVSVAF